MKRISLLPKLRNSKSFEFDQKSPIFTRRVHSAEKRQPCLLPGPAGHASPKGRTSLIAETLQENLHCMTSANLEEDFEILPPMIKPDATTEIKSFL